MKRKYITFVHQRKLSVISNRQERLMQCTRKPLKPVLQNSIVAKEALRTALVEAEGILNSRPITHVSSYAGDIEALTPIHFLLLRANLR